MYPAGQAEPSAVARVLRTIDAEDRGRLLATLVAKFHDLDLAEDVLQEAMTRALEVWADRGLPKNPHAWLMTTAKNRALDIIRSDSTRARHLARLRIEYDTSSGDHRDHADRVGEEVSTASIPDERLGLFFACSHPAVREGERTALILRFLAGLSTAEVAAVFLVDTRTMQQRIVRAKQRIMATGVPFRAPKDHDQLHERLAGVLRVVYLIFTQGFVPADGPVHNRIDLQEEALLLARLLAKLVPQETEPRGLLSLLVLTRARATARTQDDGTPIPLVEQDRKLWNSALIAEGLSLARTTAGEVGAGSYTVQASIAAVHAEAATYSETDWPQILVLYEILHRLDPSPVVALNRAVAAGKVKGPAAALAALEKLSTNPHLRRYRPFHIARAISLRDSDQPVEAESAYRTALECPGNDAESDYIDAQISYLSF